MNRPLPPHRPVLHERDGCLDACRRLRALVERFREEAPASYPEIGPHARHCVEHVGALLRGLDLGRVEYDARRRDRSMERSADRLLAAVDGMERGLTALDRERFELRIDVVQIAAPGAPPSVAPSSVRRELAFLSSHTIHHLALMGAIAERIGVGIPGELLLAFSTAAHREASARG